MLEEREARIRMQARRNARTHPTKLSLYTAGMLLLA
jgi:hypothetical protein